MEYSEAINQWLKQVKQISTELSVKDKAQITKAGAKVLEQKLTEVTKQKHYEKGIHLKDREHLADTIRMKNTDIDNNKTGESVVGFLKALDHDYSYGYIARFLNDGTKFIHGDHFITNLREEILKDVLAAERAEYQKIIKRKQRG